MASRDDLLPAADPLAAWPGGFPRPVVVVSRCDSGPIGKGPEVFREGREALTGPLSVIGSWIVRFDEPYLASQRYFTPYPRQLRDLRDSGKKGR